MSRGVVRPWRFMYFSDWPRPCPVVPEEAPPTDTNQPPGSQQVLGDGSVWEWDGDRWFRRPERDPHRIRFMHRTLPAMSVAVHVGREIEQGGREGWEATQEEIARVVAAADGDDVALIEGCAEVGLMALKRPDLIPQAIAAEVLHAASERARYGADLMNQRRA